MVRSDCEDVFGSEFGIDFRCFLYDLIFLKKYYFDVISSKK
jgi:hypothetical protein